MSAAARVCFCVCLLICVAHVHATTGTVTTITLRTSGSGRACGPTNVICDGGFDRRFTSANPATNVIPQHQDTLVEYEGTLLAGMWLSFVDSSLTGGLPCSVGAVAGAVADSTHSGPIQGQGAAAAGSACCSGSGKVIKIPQNSAATKLDATKTYSVCFADAGTTTASWKDSGIKITLTKIRYITTYGVNHKTFGTIPSHSSLTMYYTGTILNDRHVSLVDQSLNGANPCGSGTAAAAPKDNAHSGSRYASGNVFTVDTAHLSAAITFAVCYAESGGITSSIWRDTGIRLKRSKVTSVSYGVDTTRFGDGFKRITTNRNTDDHNGIATDLLPQIANVKINYAGELENDKFISLVDDSLMDPDGAGTAVGNPCAYPEVAAAGPTTGGTSSNQRAYSGPMQGRLLSGAAGGKIVTILQASGNLLYAGTIAVPKTYAVCYADGDGTNGDMTWADSYIRFQISKVETVGHHSALHTTAGHLPNTGVIAAEKLVLTYTGSLGAGTAGGNIRFSLVDATKNSVAVNSVSTPRPCKDALVSSAHAGGLSSGHLNAENSLKQVKLDTTLLHTGSITGSTLTRTIFALCYSENLGTDYSDSGIRLTVAKVQRIEHGTPVDAPYAPREMKPVLSTMLTSGLASAQNVIPQAANQLITFVSPNTIKGDPVPTGKYISLIEASLNANKPCVLPSIAGASADSLHSGLTIAASGTRDVTIPQSISLDSTKTFAVCYSITSGTTADDTWADSYVRVTISRVKQISSMSVTHKVSNYVGHIAARAASESLPTGRAGSMVSQANLLDITYSGTLAVNSYLSMVDHELGTPAKFPCSLAQATTTADAQHTNAVRAGSANTIILVTTDTLQTTSTFAVCYSTDATTWFDSGIRVKRAEVKTMLTSSTHAKPAARIQSTVFHSTNRLAQLAGQKLTYTGELANDKWLSIVRWNNNNPCVKGSNAAAAADTEHSGAMQGRQSGGGAGGKVVTVLQAGAALLDTAYTYTVCYSAEGATSVAAWQDSYIRFKITKLAYIEHTVGKWQDYAGQTIQHVTLGQLPNQYSGAPFLTVSYGGSLATGRHISLVNANLSSSVSNGITYHSPCDTPAVAAASKDSQHSGVLSAGAGSRDITTLDSTVLSTTYTYALCYAEGYGNSSDASWADSGIRITFPRVINVKFSSGHAGIASRNMNSVFYMTNVLPQSANMQLKYDGDLPTGKYFSLVNAELPLARPNPCVGGVEAARAANVFNSGVLTAGSYKNFTVPQSIQATRLDKVKVFAVCYSEANSTATSSDAWYDSYIRLRISLVDGVQVGGVTVATTGQIPNVNTADGYAFKYLGTLGVNKFVAFVDATENSNNPCIKSITSTSSPATQRSGNKQAAGNIIKTFNTAALDPARTFAFCYSEGDGSVNDGSWTDSGIRVTVPKVWNVLYDSGTQGPNCPLPVNGPVRTNCKLDTKPRDMTSMPIVTNKVPQQQNVQLSYRGSLALAQYISLVDVSLDPGANPCSNGAIAGATADNRHSGPLKAPTGSTTFVIPQTSLLDETKTYAVCYDDASLLPPYTPSTLLHGVWVADPVATTLQGFEGTSSSTTWRDSFIRVGISRISSLRVSVSNMPITNTLSYTTIKTVGQIPSQEAGKQAHYIYDGSLGNHNYISLVDAALDNTVESITQISRPNPCAVLSTANAFADTTHSGPHRAGATDKTIMTLNTATTGGANSPMDATKTFALCYAEDNTAEFFDSGIRVTVPKLTSVKYLDTRFGNPTVDAANTPDTPLPQYTRTLTSIVLATNKLPQATNQKLVYGGPLAAQKWVSLIHSTLNSGNPCANPSVAAAGADGAHSGVVRAPSTTGNTKTVAFPQSILLDASKVFSLCYSETDGSTSDLTWRDSYIRITLSKIETIVSYKVTHRVSGQIPNHAALKIDYTGSLAAWKHISFFDETLAPTTVLPGSVASYAFPCFNTSHSSTTSDSSQKIAPATGGSISGRTVTVNTAGMHVEKTFALCYTEGSSTDIGYIDSGIRITAPHIYDMLAESGYSGMTAAGVAGVPVRHMKSWDQTNGTTLIDRPTNRLALETGEKMEYVMHSTYSGAAGGRYISVVDASLNGGDPCVLGSVAAGGTVAQTAQLANVAQGKTSGGAVGGQIVTVLQAPLLSPTSGSVYDAVLAVCYTLSGGGVTSVWKDTYVRLKLTKVTSLVTVSVSHRTYGQVPNTPAADALLFEYTGALATTRWISLVDQTLNPQANGEGHPCHRSFAATPASAISSGSKRAGSLRRITNMDTQSLSTSVTFAVCYSEVTGDAADVTWADSGIRVTVPRVWNTLYGSGHTGLDCPVSTVLNAACKLDTKPRDMTSRPLATNRFPQAAGQQLQYVGTLAPNKFISLVDASLNSNNPCVSGLLAGGLPSTVRSGPVLSDASKTVTIPQATLLDDAKEYAICYDDGEDLSPVTSEYTIGTVGTSSSNTWRDSFIRVKMSKIVSFDISITNMPLTNDFTNIAIRTFGQIPNQASYKQVSYTYVGSLGIGKHISLVDAALNSELHAPTLTSRPNPCEDPPTAMSPADQTHSGKRTAVTGTKKLYSLDTKTTGGTGLLATKVFALCYSELGTSAAGAWSDSGIRITTPKLHTVKYEGMPPGLTTRSIVDREAMTSETLATHKFPQYPNQKLSYDNVQGTLPASKWISLVSKGLNNNNPCVDPVTAAGPATSERSGAIQAAGKIVTIPQSTFLNASLIFAICYATVDGTTADITWRDSFVRLTLTKIETLVSIGVTHRTTGQIGDHTALPMSYVGSLPAEKYISIIDMGLNAGSVGWGGPSPPVATSYAFPCKAEGGPEAGADNQHTGVVQAQANSKSLNVGSSNLRRATGATQNDYRQYAVCYTEDNHSQAGTFWVDSGIRLTITEVFEVLYNSGHTGCTSCSTKPDTMPRHMSSEPLSTNRLPQAAGQILTYVTHSTSTMASWGGIEQGNYKYISIVDASLATGDPCVVPAVAAATADARHSGWVRAGNNDKDVTIPQGTGTLLDARDSGTGNEIIYAVCYAKMLIPDNTWRDSYIRLKMSKIVHLAALGIAHRTVGQIPNTPASVGMEFTYTGSLAGSKYVSIVDGTLNSNFPCIGAQAAHLQNATTGQYSGTQQASAAKIVTTFDTTVLATTRLFAVCYAENTGLESDSTWTDSGIRVTVPKVTSVTYGSGYSGTPSRILTSYFVATNRLPRTAGMKWTYAGDLAASKHLSVVAASLNSGNPCVNPTFAAADRTDGGFNNNERRYSGRMTASGKTVTILQDTNNLLYSGTTTVAEVYAVCYSDGDGSNTDFGWRDSYIRLKMSLIETFATKGVVHRTYGQLPSHVSGLQYDYAGSLAVGARISLVDVTAGNLTSGTGFATVIWNPCECANAACDALATGAADARHSGPAAAVGGTRRITVIPTTQLVTSKEYALCYSSNSNGAPGAGHSGNYLDSGIRLTVPKVTGIQYSGYSQPTATLRNKSTRLMQSVLAPLQPTSQISPNVLPQMMNMPLVYVGDLAVSKHISLIAVTASLNNNNPCVDPTIAAATADSTHSGSVRSCLSYAGLCAPIGVGATTAGGKEVIIPQHVYLNDTNTFTVCYAEGDGTISDTTWRDSYIRVTISKVQNLGAMGVSHTDHGHLAHNDAQALLRTVYAGTLTVGMHLSLVDEQLNSNDPCADSAKAAGTSADKTNGIASGEFSAGVNSKEVLMKTSTLSTTTQFAVCYTVKDAASFPLSTWHDSGIRIKFTKIHTIRYNNGQTPVGQFLRDHKSAYSIVGGTGYVTTYLHTIMHKLPQIATSSLHLSYQGDLPATKYVSLVSTSLNNGDPCARADQAGHISDTLHSGIRKAHTTTKDFNITQGALHMLNTNETYTLCYSDAAGTPLSSDPTYSGMGHLAAGWRDSYIRFTLSKIDYVTSHQVQHRTQGHIANVAAYGLTYAGTLASGMRLSLVDETRESSNPCGTSAPGVLATSYCTGPLQASSSAKQVVINTTGLDTTKNFAVCYSDSGSSSSVWSDSGIRVTVSKITTLTYNRNEQQPVAQYLRVIDSTNLSPASDSFPKSTNRIPQATGLKYIYDGVMPVNRFISMVDAALNNGNPCADKTQAGASADTQHSGASQAGISGQEVTIGQALNPSKTFAVCYSGTSDGSSSSVAWRDSYIRFIVSKITKLTSYGIEHFTDGMIASKPSLRVLSSGTISATGVLSLVDETLNTYQPCTPTHASVQNASIIYSGVSRDNGGNKHTLTTNLLSSAKTFALCYAEGNGTSLDSTWSDSGLRLKTPKLTSLTYMQPVRTLEAKTCFDSIDLYGPANCKGLVTGAGLTASGGSTAIRNSQLPRAPSVVLAYHGPVTGALGTNKFVSLVEQGLGTQQNNPCRDSTKAAASATSAGTTDARLHSGVMQAGTSDTTFTIPQITGASTTGNLLDYSKSFAVCYAEDTGTASDTTWRDSYIRITLTKLQTIMASQQIVHTRGMYANVPSLRVTHTGSLETNKWLALIDTTQNSNDPCGKAYAGQSAYRRPHAANQDSTTNTKFRSPALQAGSGSRMIDFDTSMLNGNGNMYAVCYAEGNADTSDTTWMDSGMRLRFIKWTNPGKTRLVSGAASKLTFQINDGAFSSTMDKFVLLRSKTDCQTAPAAPVLSNGDAVMRRVSLSDNSITLPSGTNTTDVSAVGWFQCAGGACDSPGGYQDLNFKEGPVVICFCSADNGNGGCDDGNEFITVTSPTVPGATPRIIAKPRLGRVSGISHQKNVRALTGKSHHYNIKGSTNAGYEIANLDQIFFRATDCLDIPGNNSARETAPINLTNYDSVSTSSTFQAARVITPNSTKLTTRDEKPRVLVACFATAESLSHGSSAQDYVRLEDGLEIIPYPRLGPLSAPGDLRALSLSTPVFLVNSLKLGDYVYFKQQAVAGMGKDSDCLNGGVQVNGDIISAIPLVFSQLVQQLLSEEEPITSIAQMKAATSEIKPWEKFTVEDAGLGWIALRGGKDSKYCADEGTAIKCNRDVKGPWERFKISDAGAGHVSLRGGKDMKFCADEGTHIECNRNTVTASEKFKLDCLSNCGTSDGYAVMSPATGKLTLPAGMSTTYASYMVSCFIPAGAMPTLQQGSNCPADAPNVNVNSNGGVCTTVLQNAVKLQDDLHIFVQPTDSLVTSWFRAHVYELKFTQPQFGVYGTKTFATGQKGDLVVLQKKNCDKVNEVSPASYTIGLSRGAKMVLEEAGGETVGDEKGGVARVISLAQGKVNELPIGMYKICYATKNSEGDDPSDFMMLSEEIEILPDTATRPTVNVPRTVLLGQDLVVQWESTINLQTMLQSQNSWIGLYKNGSCMPGTHGAEWGHEQNRDLQIQIENTQQTAPVSTSHQEYIESDQHECFVAHQFIEGGVASGSVRFSQNDYQIGGTYDIRMFQGDSRNIQGRVCRGLSNVPGETYVQCILEAATINGPIEIITDRSKMDNLDGVPGMEAMFTGSRGRYTDTITA